MVKTFTINTKYGFFKMNAVDRNTIRVDANENCGSNTDVGLTFFGVRYGVNGFLRRKQGGKFIVRERDENDPYPRLYMARATAGGGEPSVTARKAAVAMLEEEVNRNITEDELLEAEIQSNEDNIKRKTEKIMEEATKIGELEKELTVLVEHGKRLEEEWQASRR